jgi:murein DD-endopeptidase MepM/ murein hydrolase activator NlpD
MTKRLVTRLGDKSSSDLSPAITASANVLVHGRRALRKGDKGHGGWRAVTGADHVLVNGRQVHRLLDAHSGSQPITSGTCVEAGNGGQGREFRADDESVVLRIKVIDCRTDVPIDSPKIEHLSIDKEVLVLAGNTRPGTKAQLNGVSNGIVSLSLPLSRVVGGVHIHVAFREFAIAAVPSRAEADAGAAVPLPSSSSIQEDGDEQKRDATPANRRRIVWRGGQRVARPVDAKAPWGWWLEGPGTRLGAFPDLGGEPIASPGPEHLAALSELPFFTSLDLDIHATDVAGATSAWREVQEAHGDLAATFPDDDSAEMVVYALVWSQPVWDDISDSGAHPGAFIQAATERDRHLHLVTMYRNVQGLPGTEYGKFGAATRDGHLHQGYDIYLRQTDPEFAVHGGLVSATRTGGAAGNRVILTVLGKEIKYFHMGTFAKEAKDVGARVLAGQVIGFAGRTGNLLPQYPTHVHLEGAAALLKSHPEAAVVLPTNETALSWPCDCEYGYEFPSTFATVNPALGKGDLRRLQKIEHEANTNDARRCIVRGYAQPTPSTTMPEKCWAQRRNICPYGEWPFRYHPVLTYMITEMIKNANGPDAEAIRTRLNRARLAAVPLGLLTVKDDILALWEWKQLVGYGMPWDHKVRIFTAYGDYQYLGGPPRPNLREYAYDIWSNIHFGFVGSSIGFSEDTLLLGAAVAQMKHDAFQNFGEFEKDLQRAWRSGALRAGDREFDQAAIRFGVTLFSDSRQLTEMSLAGCIEEQGEHLAHRPLSTPRTVPAPVDISHLP